MLSAEVASSMTQMEPFAGAVSNKSAKFFEHAASISLWALKICPETERDKRVQKLHPIVKKTSTFIYSFMPTM
jgi:hypothetical protein